jgi:aminoglycoside/choline kinase family phosphotransferase
MPERMARLEAWTAAACGQPIGPLEPASTDASFRRYFRVRLAAGDTRIVMDAPPANERPGAFVELAQRFGALGIHVPRVFASDLEHGFALLEDLGARHYLDELDSENVERLYGDALSTLMALQACGPRDGLPPYDQALLERELGIFSEWLLDRHLGLELAASERQMLGETFAALVQNALEQPQVCVHRDYHSRNLMLGPPPRPGVLDFQDAVIGPVTYDLVSLLRDCYIAWPAERVDAWAWGYFELAVQSGVLRPEHESDFLRWFDLMGVQRHLKAAGIFARLNHRDGKPGYLADIPRTLGYVVGVAKRRPQVAALAEFVSVRVLPGIT